MTAEPVSGHDPLPAELRRSLDGFEVYLRAEQDLAPRSVRAYVSDAASLLTHASRRAANLRLCRHRLRIDSSPTRSSASSFFSSAARTVSERTRRSGRAPRRGATPTRAVVARQALIICDKGSLGSIRGD